MCIQALTDSQYAYQMVLHVDSFRHRGYVLFPALDVHRVFECAFMSQTDIVLSSQ